MHLVKAFENTAGVKSDKPYIRQEYYPLSVNRYITFQPFSKYHSKNYPYWGDVLKMIGNEFIKHGISIVQLGAKNEQIFEGVYSCVGGTSINQTAYIIQNGLAHVGADSFMAHIAGYLNKPSVIIYGNNYIKNSKPYWGNPKSKYIDAYGEFKPSLSEYDYLELIKKIKPETIAKSICDLVGIKFSFPFETVWTGKRCESLRFDVVPNQVLSPKTFKTHGYVIRMDFEHNEEMMMRQLQQCPCTIVADKPVVHPDLPKFKNRIHEFAYLVKDSGDAEYVEYLHKMGFNYYLNTRLSDEELNNIKIDFLDFHPIIQINKYEADFLNDEDRFFIDSKRIILSNQKIYSCKTAYKLNKPIKNIHSLQEFDNSFLDDDFYEDLETMRFFKLKK